jgi:hypothetical protein
VPSTPIAKIRFPDGDVEYRTTRSALEVGARIRSRGVVWRVTGYDGSTVLVVRDESISVAPSIDQALPYPLGVEPPTIEILAVA